MNSRRIERAYGQFDRLTIGHKQHASVVRALNKGGMENAQNSTGHNWDMGRMLSRLIIAIACFAGTHVVAGNSNEFQTEYEIYTDRMQQFREECIGEQYSTAAIVDCQLQELDKLDSELNRVYKILMKRMNRQSKEALLASQRIWIKYRDAEHKFIDELIKTKQGTMYQNVYLVKKSEILGNRVSELHGHLHTLNN